MEGTYDIPNKNSHFFVTTEPNQMGFRQNANNLLYFYNLLPLGPLPIWSTTVCPKLPFPYPELTQIPKLKP